MHIKFIPYFDPEENKTRISVWEAPDVLRPSRNRSERTLKKLIAANHRRWLAISTYKKVHMEYWAKVVENSHVIVPGAYLSCVEGRYFFYSCHEWPHLQNKWYTREEVYGEKSQAIDKID